MDVTLSQQHGFQGLRPPYTAYFPSRVSWADRLPAHWEARRLKHVFRVLNGSTPDTTKPEYWDGEIDWATPNDLGQLQSDTITSTQRTITQAGYQNSGTTLAPVGSIVLSTRAPIGHVAVAGVPLTTNQGCRTLVMRSQDDSRYFYYQFVAARPVLESLGAGSTFAELSNGELGNVQLCYPSPSEQSAIVTFLDRETARIDMLIAKKRQLIERLQEHRIALLSQAVTKGLDPDAPMKKSGIEWLGEMPAHWVVRPLWSVGQLQRGFDLTTEEHELGEVPVYSSSGLSGYHDKALVKGPGVVTGRYGTIGKVYYVPEDYWPMNTTLYVKNFWGNDPQFVFYLLQLLPFDAFSDKSAVPGIDRNDLHRLRVPVPPLREQVEIVCFLRATEKQFSQITEKAELMTARLTEYRAALISAAVTGKIDVRGAVA